VRAAAPDGGLPWFLRIVYAVGAYRFFAAGGDVVGAGISLLGPKCGGLAKMVTGNEVSAVRSVTFPARFRRAEIRSLSPHLPNRAFPLPVEGCPGSSAGGDVVGAGISLLGPKCGGLAKMVTGNEVSAVRSVTFPARFRRAEIRSLSPHLPNRTFPRISVGLVLRVWCLRRGCLPIFRRWRRCRRRRRS